MRNSLLIAVSIAVLASVASAQVDPYRYDDPDLQEAQYYHGLALERRGVIHETIDDIEQHNAEMEVHIRAAGDSIDDAKEFTSRMAGAEGILGQLSGLFSTELLFLLLGVAGIGTTAGVARKQHKGRKLAEAAAEQFRRRIPIKTGKPSNGKAPGYSVPDGLVTGEYDIEAAKVVADASRNS